MNIHKLTQVVAAVSGKPVHNILKMRSTLLAVRNKIMNDFPQSAKQTDDMFKEILAHTRGNRGKGGRKSPHNKLYVKSVAHENHSNTNSGDHFKQGYLERFFGRGRTAEQNQPCEPWKLPFSERYKVQP